MRTVLCVGLVAMALLGSALPSEAWHGHARGFVGPVIVHPWGPVWVGPYPYPVVVEPTPPPVYVEPAAPQPVWYFCQSPRGYYPEVPQCPGGWTQVVPQPTPGQ